MCVCTYDRDIHIHTGGVVLRTQERYTFYKCIYVHAYTYMYDRDIHVHTGGVVLRTQEQCETWRRKHAVVLLLRSHAALFGQVISLSNPPSTPPSPLTLSLPLCHAHTPSLHSSALSLSPSLRLSLSPPSLSFSMATCHENMRQSSLSELRHETIIFIRTKTLYQN